MCIYDNPEESYEAFVIIWEKWYKTLPTLRQAGIWTGADHAKTWRKNVLYYYYK